MALAHRAVVRAAQVTRHVQTRLSESDRMAKADDSPVTIGDFAAQAVVAATLRDAHAEAKMVNEESSATLRLPGHRGLLEAATRAASIAWPGVTPESLLEAIDFGSGPGAGAGVRGSAGRDGAASYWTLDPIDGTKGFLRGHQYSICLAYVHEGHVAVAALACPNLSAEDPHRPYTDPDPRGLVLLARRDESELPAIVGAGVGGGGGGIEGSGAGGAAPSAPMAAPMMSSTTLEVGRVVSIGRREESAPGALRFVQSYESSHSRGAVREALARRLAALGMPTGEPARIDSQCKYALVSLGRADVFLRVVRDPTYSERIWDHASGALIAEAAGLSVSDVEGRSLRFNDPPALGSRLGILVAPRATHAAALRELPAAMAEAGVRR